MKNLFCIAIIALVLLTTGLCAAETPSLFGRWISTWSGYIDGKGFTNSTEEGILVFDITSQKDRIFEGRINYSDNKTLLTNLAGTISIDGKKIYIAESNGGYCTGEIISNNELEIIYLKDGQNGMVAIDKLKRING